MSEQTSTSEEPSSKKPLTCSSDKLQELTDKVPIETIVTLEEDGSRRILLKDIDGELYWRPYGGETIEEIRKFHEWELAAQRKLKDKSRSSEEMDVIRNVLMSLGVLTQFLSLESDMSDYLLAATTERIALMMYRNDKQDQNITLESNDDDAKVYLTLAHHLVVNFYICWNAISTSVEKSNEETKQKGE